MQNPFQLEFKPLISTRNSRYFRLGGVFLDSDRGTSKWFETVSTDYDPLYENLQRQKGPRRDRQKTSALYFLLWLFQVLNPSQWQSLHSKTIKTNTIIVYGSNMCSKGPHGTLWAIHFWGLHCKSVTDPRWGNEYCGSLALCQIFFIQSDHVWNQSYRPQEYKHQPLSWWRGLAFMWSS